ncbi:MULTISPECIES: response regulator [Paenibacillus]|uniref:response regulator n=1 Tax=Paenibacillus TaxID=44249 RepID=UPI0022B867C2|nr:response regulator [Paenibacillus caseinilyticus]MCZ8521649.1 response regulator [Paenibacillus caseinilyticus]
MYQALIAEDSKPIVRHLTSLLEASGLPVQVAATAANGEEALELCRRRPVDILLTDIRMPKMDGLTLIARAKEINAKLKTVLISGYNDFEYTRKALNLQVCDYLLKPVDRAELVEVMERIVARLEEERPGDRSVLEGIAEQGSGGHPLALDAAFLAESKLLWVVRRQIFTPPWDPLAPAEMQTRLAEIFEGSPHWLFRALDPRELLVFTNACSADHRRPATLMDMMQSRLEQGGRHVSIACRPEPVDPKNLAATYKEMSRLLKERSTLSKPLLLDTSLPLPVPASPAEADMDRLAGVYTGMIQKLQKDRFLLQLSEQLNNWADTPLPDCRLESFVYRLAAAFEVSSSPLGEQELRNSAEQARKLLELPSYASFCSRLLAYSSECFERLQASNRKGGSELFQHIEAHLRSNLYAQVTMTDLSARFHVSPSYISRIVKRYSENTFVQYYLQLKVREAQRLMKAHPDMKLKDISDALCFHDQHYFSKVFKEYAGCSPSEYKAAFLVEGLEE